MPNWSVVVPVKRVEHAKSRLRDAVPGLSHESLVVAVVLDTIDAVLGCPTVSSVVVVTDDPEVTARLGSESRVKVVPDEPGAGLNPALLHGVATVVTRHPDDAVAVLGSDRPALRPSELAAALRAASGSPRSYLPDHSGDGTALLAVQPGVVLDPRFGPRSALAHRASGAFPLDGDWPSLRRDTDTAADLFEARLLGLGRRTSALLATWPDRPAETVSLVDMQATVREFDPATRTGSVLLDDGTAMGFDAPAFEASGLRLLRLGQRVTLDLDPHGQVSSLTIPTLG